uniref:Uncharacterized protein n=1 Tax=Fagus sylvatica TaxID=28930 RepID=A0A2N9FII3_FAGSY
MASSALTTSRMLDLWNAPLMEIQFGGESLMWFPCKHLALLWDVKRPNSAPGVLRGFGLSYQGGFFCQLRIVPMRTEFTVCYLARVFGMLLVAKGSVLWPPQWEKIIFNKRVPILASVIPNVYACSIPPSKQLLLKYPFFKNVPRINPRVNGQSKMVP